MFPQLFSCCGSTASTCAVHLTPSLNKSHTVAIYGASKPSKSVGNVMCVHVLMDIPRCNLRVSFCSTEPIKWGRIGFLQGDIDQHGLWQMHCYRTHLSPRLISDSEHMYIRSWGMFVQKVIQVANFLHCVLTQLLAGCILKPWRYQKKCRKWTKNVSKSKICNQNNSSKALRLQPLRLDNWSAAQDCTF